MIQKIVMIGAGNLATQLSLVFHENGIEILQVYSRTVESAKALATQLDCGFTTSVNKIENNADLYVFALSDRALQPVLDELSIPLGKVVHTAGSISVNVFKNHSESYGVFYPLQTFSKNRKVDFQEIPICVESNNMQLQEDLIVLAKRISGNVHLITSEQRSQLHLAAVFTCNFANHMFSIGQELLAEKEVDFELLKPLISETANKVLELDPISAQTGPAVRFDEEIMSSHEKALKNTPHFQKLYRFVSESIFKMHKGK